VWTKTHATLAAVAGVIDPDSHVVLSDGRKLGYREFGDPNGVPLLWFPGLPGCCRLAHPGDEAVPRRSGARLIVVERPGFGISDFLPGRRLLDYPSDVAELADALGLDAFLIAGVSGAGPSLAACAYALPERVRAVGMIGCAAPVRADAALDGMARSRKRFMPLFRYVPGLGAAAMRLLGLDRDPERLYSLMSRGAAPGDLAWVRSPAVWQRRITWTREAMRSGARGFAWELHLLLQPWGFELADIRVPVEIWHGLEDRSTPIGMGRYLAATIPGARARFLEGEGHYIAEARLGEVLDTLCAYLPRASS
jgi:pimeloyl-ACP methyl ester carboxylesterase